MRQRKLENWQTLQSKDVFVASPWIRVATQKIRLPNGRVVEDYHQIELGDFAIVYAKATDGRIIVERQYKHGIGRVTLVLPAGMIEPGEPPLKAAQRELLEETGYSAETWTFLGKFAVNGNYGCGNAHIFMAQGAHPVAEPQSGDLEDIEIILMKPSELVESIKDGNVHLLGTAVAVALGTNPLFGFGAPEAE